MLGHRLGVGADVAGDHGVRGQLLEGELVGAGGQQLHEPGAQCLSLGRPELAPPVPHEQHVGRPQHPDPLLFGEVGHGRDPCRATEELVQPFLPRGEGHRDQRRLHHDLGSSASAVRKRSWRLAAILRSSPVAASRQRRLPAARERRWLLASTTRHQSSAKLAVKDIKAYWKEAPR
jgi:hypothetical protein